MAKKRSGMVNAAKLSWITRRSLLSLETLNEDGDPDSSLTRRATYSFDIMAGSGGELSRFSNSQHHHQALHRTVSEIPHSSKLSLIHHTHLHRRDKDEKVDKSFGPSLQPSNVHEGLKNEWMTPNGSQNGSRSTSVFGSADDAQGVTSPQRDGKVVKEGEVKAVHEKAALFSTEVEKALRDLDTEAHNSTSRLDNTYYSVLEKLNALNTTVASLKQLASMTRKLNDDFVQESAEAATQIEAQLDTFQGFEEQGRKIEALEQRIGAGREKAQTLGFRVEVMKEKLERWERVEGEWQQRTRKRLKILWVIVTVVTLFISTGLVAIQYTSARTQGPGVLRGMNISGSTLNISEIESKWKNETLSLKRSPSDALAKLQRLQNEELEEDPRLRAFDEL